MTILVEKKIKKKPQLKNFNNILDSNSIIRLFAVKLENTKGCKKTSPPPAKTCSSGGFWLILYVYAVYNIYTTYTVLQ